MNSPSTDQETALVAQIMEDYLAKLEAGEPVDLETLLAGHTEVATRVRDCLQGLQLVRDVSTRATADTASDSLPEIQHIGEYKIIREIGRGGMGVVYEAHQQSLDRRVALKVLPFAAFLDERQLKRFKDEARAAASLKHPNIVSVYAVGCERSVYFYAMELIDGHDLAAVIRRIHHEHQLSISNDLETVAIARLSTERSSQPASFFRSVARIGLQAAEALQYAHDDGIIHRDIKPDNLLLDQNGQIHIADFGLAQVNDGCNLTMTGDMVGTLRYMSPEQVERGAVVDERSDVYSLGLTLYEFLAGRPAFAGDSRALLIKQITESSPPSLRRICRSIPDDLATIIHKAIATEPIDRYVSAKEMAEDLEAFLNVRSIRARRATPIARLRRFSKRNPILFAAIGFTFVLMAMLAGVSSLLAWNFSKQAKDEAAQVAQAAVDARLQRISQYANEMRLGKSMADERRRVELQDLLLRWVPKEGAEDFRGFEWFHLWFQCNDSAMIHTYDHEIPTYQASFLSDFELATSDFLNRARIWSLQDGQRSKPRTYLPMSAQMNQVLFFDRQQGRIFISNGKRQVVVWDAETGQQRRVLSLFDERGKGELTNADSLDLSNDGRFLLVGSGSWESGSVQVLDLTTDGKTIYFDQPSRALARFGPEGQIIAVNAMSGQVEIRNSETGDLIRTVPISASGIWSMEISRDKSLVAFGTVNDRGADSTYDIELWETTSWRRMWSLPVPNRVEAIEFDIDGRLFGWGDKQGNVQIAEIDSSEKTVRTWRRKKLHSQNVDDLDFSPNQKMLATASGDGFVSVWNLDRLRLPSESEVNFSERKINSLGSQFADDQNTIATSVRTQGIILWDGASGQQLERKFEFTGTEHYHYIDSASREDLVCSVFGYWPHAGPTDPRRSEVVVWNGKTGDVRMRLGDLPPLGNSMTSCAISPDGKFVAACSHHEGVIVIDVEQSKVVSKLAIQGSMTTRFSRDSKLLAVGTHDHLTSGKVNIVSVPEFAVLQQFPMEDRQVNSVDISPDGRYVATVGFERRVKLYDRTTGTTRLINEKLRAFPSLVRFSPDGKRILTASLDGKVRLWLTETGDQVMNWDIPANNWPSGNFSSSGDAIVVGGIRFAKVLNAPCGEELRRLSASDLRSQASQKVSHDKAR